MKVQQYSVNQHLIETILSWVKSKEIAIPEIQRPFVWNSTQVRDLIDSLYQGFPVGYLIAWRNPNVKLKDGTTAEGKKILIDGQQRVLALSAALLGEQLISKNYKKTKIQIAFHPIKQQFEVFNPAIAKDNSWIKDISQIISGEERLSKFIKNYCVLNPNTQEEKVEDALENIRLIPKKQIGLIELDPHLKIETVTEIFIRINSKGVELSQADFVMSKIAANESYGGSTLRKCIDYFCHMAISPEFYNIIADIDADFKSTEYFKKISWLKNENDDLYDPLYGDLLRVAFTSEFNRGKLADLVSLLSGRNFETRTFEEEIAKESFDKLSRGIINFVNETNFKRFIMIIKSAGFIDPYMIRSQNALNFAYIVYLKLKSLGYNAADTERYVRKWFVLSILTGRYSGSAESAFDYDIRNISSREFSDYLYGIEQAELSDAFWNVALVQSLESPLSSSPYYNVFLASQVKFQDRGFLSRDISVFDLITHRGDIHHIFPQQYLKKNGLTKNMYNQIANYAYMQSEINIKIGDKSPKSYFSELTQQCNGSKLKYGGINDIKLLMDNLEMNCIPKSIFEMDISNYDDFLNQRRKLMADKIKKYYESL